MVVTLPTPNSLADWLAYIALIVTTFFGVVSLGGLAWSAVGYVRIQKKAAEHERYRRLFELSDQIGKSGGAIAGKMVAFYELRKYPEYADVIVRICDDVKVEGTSAAVLKREMKLTADVLRPNKKDVPITPLPGTGEGGARAKGVGG